MMPVFFSNTFQYFADWKEKRQRPSQATGEQRKITTH